MALSVVSSGYKTYQGHICHGVDHDTLVLISVLSDSAKARL